jgi:hypothetical protein
MMQLTTTEANFRLLACKAYRYVRGISQGEISVPSSRIAKTKIMTKRTDSKANWNNDAGLISLNIQSSYNLEGM